LLGYRVTGDRRSLNALKTFRANPRGFDLILTDQSMPEMTGVQLCARVRMLNPDIPVILCTGYSDQVNQQTAGHFQIDRFLLKPVSRATLARTVAEVLRTGRRLAAGRNGSNRHGVGGVDRGLELSIATNLLSKKFIRIFPSIKKTCLDFPGKRENTILF
jgi:YesN/AraC family two-component response regulator